MPASLFVGAALACAGLQAALASRVFLFWDDYYFLGEARDVDLTWDYLSRSLFTHFSPVTRLANWLIVDAIAPHPWVLPAAVSVMVAMVVFAATWLMTVLFGRTWLALTGSVVLGVSLTLLPLATWWTAGANILPGMAGFLAAFAAMVLVMRGASRWWAVLALVCAAVSVLDYETPMLLPGFLGLWLLLFGSRTIGESWVRVLRRTWWSWLGLLLVSGGALVNYRLNYYTPVEGASVTELLEALARSLFANLVPTTLGLHDPRAGWIATASIVVGCVVLTGLVGWLLVTREGAWRGLLFAGVGWLLPTLALLLNRLGRYGMGVADDAIYTYLPTALVVIGVLEAVRAPLRRTAPGWVPPATLVRLTLPTLVLAVVGSYAWSVGPTTYYRVPAGADATFVERARATAAATREEVGEFSVIDSVPNSPVMPEGYGRYSRASNVMGITVPGLSFDDPEPPYYRFGQDGSLLPAPIEWRARAGDARATDTGRFSIVGATDLSFSPERGNCFTATGSTHIDWRLPVVEGEDLVVRALVTVDAPSDLVVAVATAARGGFGYPDPIDPGDTVLSPSGTGTLEIVAGTSIAGVRLRNLTPDTAVCLRAIEVGEVRSADAP